MKIATAVQSPNLRLDLPYSVNQAPIDLHFMLHLGASVLDSRTFHVRQCSAELGPHLANRVPIVARIYDCLCASIAMGISPVTIKNRVRAMRYFSAWCDDNGRELTLESARDDFLAWSENLLHRVMVTQDISYGTAYGYVRNADVPISKAIGLAGQLLRLTRMRHYDRRLKRLGRRADTQSLEDAVQFGKALFDITTALTCEAVFGELPLTILLHNGFALTEWSWAVPGSTARPVDDEQSPSSEVDGRTKALRSRGSLINLRIEAELLTFIAQTGMNLAQAYNLRQGQIRHVRTGDDSVTYRVYKRRRGGEAEFHVYRSYRSLFDGYLKWREAISTPDDTRLFPFIHYGSNPSPDSFRGFEAIKTRVRKAGLPWVGPQKLRRTRVNWLLRRSGNPSLTAQMAQHSETILLSTYAEPNHHLASVEITRFQNAIDPYSPATGPGACVRSHGAAPILDSPGGAPLPDCVSPSGCLFCTFHRDVDSEDYVWSLTTLRLLKRLELERYIPSVARNGKPAPAEIVIKRIGELLQEFSSTSEIRAAWVTESEARVREGRYHEFWDAFIQCLES